VRAPAGRVADIERRQRKGNRLNRVSWFVTGQTDHADALLEYPWATRNRDAGNGVVMTNGDVQDGTILMLLEHTARAAGGVTSARSSMPPVTGLMSPVSTDRRRSRAASLWSASRGPASCHGRTARRSRARWREVSLARLTPRLTGDTAWLPRSGAERT